MKTTTDILKPIGDAVRSLLDRISEGEVTTKMIIAELSRVAEMLSTMITSGSGSDVLRSFPHDAAASDQCADQLSV